MKTPLHCATLHHPFASSLFLPRNVSLKTWSWYQLIFFILMRFLSLKASRILEWSPLKNPKKSKTFPTNKGVYLARIVSHYLDSIYPWDFCHRGVFDRRPGTLWWTWKRKTNPPWTRLKKLKNQTKKAENQTKKARPKLWILAKIMLTGTYTTIVCWKVHPLPIGRWKKIHKVFYGCWQKFLDWWKCDEGVIFNDI